MEIKITKYNRSSLGDYPFAIIIPSWNNRPYLEMCIRSIRQNSALNPQIIVLANEANDDTLEYLKAQKEIDFIHAEQNIGICYGVNSARSMVKSKYIMYMNDDMYVLPHWDTRIMNAAKATTESYFMLSSTMVEPHDTGNPCVVVSNYGDDIESFEESKIITESEKLVRLDWNGSTWPPNLMPVELWDLIGGFSTEFSPGMYSDPDLSMKCYEMGVRYFRGVGDSLVYHFGSKSTKRVKRNHGRIRFLQKWGITSKTFNQHILKLGIPFTGILPESELPMISRIANKTKRFWYSFQ